MGAAKPSAYYDAAFETAVSLFRAADADDVCAGSGADREDGMIIFSYFGKNYGIDSTDAGFHPDDISLMEKVLILHYLTSNPDKPSSNPPKGEYVSFETLPNGMFYNYAFRKFGPAILLKSFGEEPEKILAAEEALNGCRESYGDVSVRFTVLPNIDVIVVLHRGDDEFPPEANILFRDNIIEYLSLEDIARLGGLIAIKIAAISTAHL